MNCKQCQNVLIFFQFPNDTSYYFYYCPQFDGMMLIHQTKNYGITITDNSYSSKIIDNEILYSNGTGLHLESQIYNSVIDSNTIKYHENGLKIIAPLWSSNSNNISNNIIDFNSDLGIDLNISQLNNLTNNRICDNGGTNIMCPWDNGYNELTPPPLYNYFGKTNYCFPQTNPCQGECLGCT